mmetsp:Transcript_27504/g.59107  ORF Transcript_27504/g.59107 Transcript_27504/m.59107 type:complete len:488 (+) Transcript_27504:68-1531(+)
MVAKCPVSNNSGTSCPFASSNAHAATSYPNAAKLNDDGIITNLNSKRSSEGMGLPEAMSKETIDMIIATAPVVAPKALDITKCFYGKVLGKHPELKQFFNTSVSRCSRSVPILVVIEIHMTILPNTSSPVFFFHPKSQHNVPISDHQPKALAASIIAYATNINDLAPLLVEGGPIESICHRHVALAIHPMQYVVVHENLMAAIGEVLGEVVTPAIAAAWSEAVLFLAKAMIDTEEPLYQMVERREGGWSGFAEFEVSKIVALTEVVKQVSFRPPADSPLSGKKFAFTEGQYLTIQIDIDGDGLTAPRHYTATSPTGADYLQCTIKKQTGGKVSTYVHEQLKVGDKVTLATPMGVFILPEEPSSSVLMSAGIGVTPMVNMKRKLGDSLKLVVHVDRYPESHPYREFFEEDSNSKTLFKYTRVTGRPTVEDLVGETLEMAGTDNEFFICGPEKWMMDVQEALMAKGAKKVVCEVFGSQLATGCPFFQTS